MKLIITETQEKTIHKIILQEYGGYVSGFERIIKYIYTNVQKTINTLLKQDKDIITKLNNKYTKEDNIDSIIKPLTIDEQTLNKLGLRNIKQFIMHYYVSNDKDGGGFNKNGTTMEDNKFNQIEIYLNLSHMVETNMSNLNVILQHELTHAYQLLRMYRQQGEEHTDNTFDNRYYTADITKNNIPQIFSYAFSKIELNAYVSELYTFLQQSNADFNNYKEVVKESSIYDKYNLLVKIEKAFNGNNRLKHTKEVMEWIDNNPEHVDMFPSKNGMTIEKYNKRLIAMCNDKLNYLSDKIRKITERYLIDLKTKKRE